MGQSRISTHLGLLQDSGLVQSRREGKRTFYKLSARRQRTAGEFIQLAIRGAKELPEYAEIKSISSASSTGGANRRRSTSIRSPADLTGSMARAGPGRRFGHLLLRILPPLVVADLGSGEGLLSELLARRCKKVIAVDNSEKIVAFGAAKAKKNHLKNLEFRLGDLQNPPIEPESVDLVILSQALHHAEEPAKAIAGSAYRHPQARRPDHDPRPRRTPSSERPGALRRPLARICRKRPAPLAGGGRVQEDRDQASSPAKNSPPFRDHPGWLRTRRVLRTGLACGGPTAWGGALASGPTPSRFGPASVRFVRCSRQKPATTPRPLAHWTTRSAFASLRSITHE